MTYLIQAILIVAVALGLPLALTAYVRAERHLDTHVGQSDSEHQDDLS